MDTIRPPDPRVLVVDNCHEAAVSLAWLLERWGFQPVLAYDGPSALAVALARPPDAVLLEVGLPGMDGYEVARRLRGRPQTAPALLIALTRYGQEEDLGRCREAGIDLHLLKPYEPEELHRALDGRSADRPTPEPVRARGPAEGPPARPRPPADLGTLPQAPEWLTSPGFFR
jgi:CheY-like chemotaxis protein